ncbi:uncharacterized protein LOC111244543 [Varroa destructor]|uniref:Uncharacterized protein n=1 Tax=Varroa destructor TaxID=109461 RepID=A0A7M7MAA9_VARDE|nr:uncharacterized protein LOC111244543 [Varroa destructor]
MAESSSDSSELRNYLTELRKRTNSLSRIPKPAQSADSFIYESKAADGNISSNAVDSSVLVAGRSGRAAALLNKVAGLGIGQRQRRQSQAENKSGSPTSSPTLSNSKKEVSFSDRQTIPSKIPRSPQLVRRQNDSATISISPPRQKTGVESKSRSSQTKSPDVGRHQIRRSPSPYHKNCQHSFPSSSPEPQRTPSPRVKSARLRTGSTKNASSTVTESSASKNESKPDIEGLGEKDTSAKCSTAKLASDSTNKTSTTTKTSTETVSTKTVKHEKNAAEDYSDTFEKSTPKMKSTSSKYIRSKSLDTGQHKRTCSDGRTLPATGEGSFLRTLKKSKSTSLASSRSTTVPDWWFPAILPPQHFGGEHLEELQKLHAGVLDDLFRFQIGVIEKHQQRADSRYKAVREFVKKSHEYTNWRAYQSDPRVQFVKWHKATSHLKTP